MPRARRLPAVARPTSTRTDLLRPAPTTQTAPDQTYGNQTAQQQSMKMLPVGPQGSASQLPGQAPVPMPPQQPGTRPNPGELDWLGPSKRPAEPLTHGLPTGPGAGPEVLQGVGALAHAQMNEQGTLKALLGSLASTPGASTAVKDLASGAGAI